MTVDSRLRGNDESVKQLQEPSFPRRRESTVNPPSPLFNRLPGDAPIHLSSLLFLFLLTASMAFLYGGIDATRPEYADWDVWDYTRMAQAVPGLADNVASPFVYRLAGPYLAGLLPYPEPEAFRLLALLFSFTLVMGFYGLLCSQGLRPWIAAVTVSLFTFNKHHFGFNLWDYFQVNDVLVLICMTVMLWALYGERWRLFGIVLCLGAAAKETCLLLIPAALVYLCEKGTLPRQWRTAVEAFIPGLFVFLSLRALIAPAGGPSPVESFLTHSTKVLSFTTPLHLLVNPFLPFVFLPFIYLKATVQFFSMRKHLLIFGVLVLFSSLFGANNERLMAPASLVFYWLIGTILQECGAGRVFIGCCLGFGFLSSFHDEIGRWPLPGHTWAMVVSLVALMGVTGAGIYNKWYKNSQTQPKNT